MYADKLYLLSFFAEPSSPHFLSFIRKSPFPPPPSYSAPSLLPCHQPTRLIGGETESVRWNWCGCVCCSRARRDFFSAAAASVSPFLRVTGLREISGPTAGRGANDCCHRLTPRLALEPGRLPACSGLRAGRRANRKKIWILLTQGKNATNEGGQTGGDL